MRSSQRGPGVWTYPAGSSSSRGSRTATGCAISSRKYARRTAIAIDKCGRAGFATLRSPVRTRSPVSPKLETLPHPSAFSPTCAAPMVADLIDFHAYPDAAGHFGRFGGRFVAETLIGPLEELAAAYDAARVDPAFIEEFERDLAHYVGRPSPIYYAQRLSAEVGGARILFKREDLNHTSAHKINNTIGQALLAPRMGKTRIIAATGTGQ